VPALMLVVVFGVAVGVNLYRGRSIRCYCMGASSREVIGVATLLRLAAIALIAVLVFQQPDLNWRVGAAGPGRLAGPGSMVISLSLLLWLLAPAETILREAWSVHRERVLSREGGVA
jgi:hypothetical protein